MTDSILVVIPWHLVQPDNAKYGIMKGRMLLTSKYRKCKDDIGWIAFNAMADYAHERVGRCPDPLTGPVSLIAKLYEPNRSRKRDITNYAKLIGDAMNAIIYADDHQIDVATWLRMPIDPRNPRIECTITPIIG